MVIKTDICSFSEFRIYPGRGTKFIRRDGQIVTFFGSKTASLYHQKKKPAKLTWTLAWRRLNKKEAKLDTTRKRRKRVVKMLNRPVVGVSAEAIRKRRNERPEQRQAAREAALREVKARNKKKGIKK